MKTKKSELELYSFSSKKMKTRGWSTKFASGLNIIYRLSSKSDQAENFTNELTFVAAKGRGPAGIHTFSSILCIELLDNRTGHYLINMTYTRKRSHFKAASAQLFFHEIFFCRRRLNCLNF